MFAMFAVYIFGESQHHHVYNYDDDAVVNTTASLYELSGSFDNVPIAFLRLMVLFSSENFPLLLLPSWAESKSSFLYFGLFTYVGTFFLKGILLATIVHIYLKRARQQVDKERKKEWKGLVKAFDLLDYEHRGFITFDIWNDLMVLIRPKSSEEERSFLFNVHSPTGELDMIDFLDLREITQLHLTEVDDDDGFAFQLTKCEWLVDLFGRLDSPKLTLFLCFANNIISFCHHYGMSIELDRMLLSANLGVSATILLLVIGKAALNKSDKLLIQIDVGVVAVAALFYSISVTRSNPANTKVLTVIAHVSMFSRPLWVLAEGRKVMEITRRIVYSARLYLCIIFQEDAIGFHACSSHEAKRRAFR
jgi:hypothetical protein